MSSNPFKIFENKIKNKELNRSSFIDGFENVYTDNSTKGNDNTADQKSEFLGLAISKQKLKKIFIIIVILLGLLLSKVAYLQLVKGDYYHNIAEKNRIRIIPIKASRGIIYDRNNVQLVQNIPNFALYITPIDLPYDENERDEIFIKIYNIIQNDLNVLQENFINDLREKIKKDENSSYKSIMVHENIKQDEAVLLKIESNNLPGVDLMLESKRNYLLISDQDDVLVGESLSHIVGYLGRISKDNYQDLKDRGYLISDYIGITGVELFFEDILRGENGKKRIEVDALGKIKKIIAQKEPTLGKNIVLTVDVKLQKFAEKTLLKYLEKNDKKRGSIIIQNPQNGEILTMVSLPAFDNNLFSGGISNDDYQKLINNSDSPLFNRSVSGEYPPGSTFKIVVAAAALEEDIITNSTLIYSQGGIQIDKWFFPDWKAGGHGQTNVTKALAESVNTYFYYIGGGYDDFDGLGVEKISEYADKFYFGNKTGITLTSESDGFLPSIDWKETVKEERWYIGDTYHYAIGQGDVLVTPIQISNTMSVFANKGTLYKPTFLKEVLGSENTKYLPGEIIKEDFINKQNIETIRQGLRQAVIYGSAKYLYDLPVAVAGKTGTAQWSSEKEPHSWFTGFAPYDEPEIVITVLVEEGGEGTAIAVPIAKEILYWYFISDEVIQEPIDSD